MTYDQIMQSLNITVLMIIHYFTTTNGLEAVMLLVCDGDLS